LETTKFSPGSFDVVWGEAILHHLIPELETLAPRIVSLVKPGGLIVFAEPISLSPGLRRLRLKLARPSAAAPDDRPLEGGEIDLLRRHFPGLAATPFRLLGRLDRFVLPDFQYERASAWRRRTLDALALADRALLAIPCLRRYASTAVLWATRQAL
jgi:SAM-dependent methyltransferase